MVGGSHPTEPPPAPITSRETLTDYLRPSPKFEGTQLLGLEVYPGKSSAVFFRMGLQAGDVITAIDGVPIQDAAVALDQLRSLFEGGTVTVSLARGKQSQTIALNGSYAASDQAPRGNLVSKAAISGQGEGASP
jgi:hypothetical protein